MGAKGCLVAAQVPVPSLTMPHPSLDWSGPIHRLVIVMDWDWTDQDWSWSRAILENFGQVLDQSSQKP